MGYSTSTDIQDRFGASNVTQWADLDNDNSSVKIAARIARAIVVADTIIKSALRRSSYTEGYANAAGTVDPLIVDISATLAGVWLYEARGTSDRDPDGNPVHILSATKKAYLEMLEQIAAGVLRLDAL